MMRRDGNGYDGRVVIVTGGGAGIGRAIALAFGAAGASVGILDTSVDNAEGVAAEIRATGARALALGADVTARHEVERAVTRITADLGPLYALVNNAGVGHVRPLLEISDEDVSRVFNVNILGVLHGIQVAAASLISTGQPGCILNTASVAGKEGRPLLAVYAMSKAAVISLTRSAAHALAPYGIRVNAVCPGVVETDLYRRVRRELDEAATGRPSEAAVPPAPLGDVGSADDVASMMVYLAGPGGAYITGQAINVDGGRVMHG